MGEHRVSVHQQKPEGGGVSPTFSADEVVARLERLWQKLEDEGRYTDANTVALAIEKIRDKST